MQANAEQLTQDVKLNDEIARVERTADRQTVAVFLLVAAVGILAAVSIWQRGELQMLREHNAALSAIVTDFQTRGGGK